MLSQKLLHWTSKIVRCDFYITDFVQYECLNKPYSTSTAAESKLMARLRHEQSRGTFKPYSCGIEDLQDIKLHESRQRLGMGELSSIAFAMKTN